MDVRTARKKQGRRRRGVLRSVMLRAGTLLQLRRPQAGRVTLQAADAAGVAAGTGAAGGGGGKLSAVESRR